ncbi:N-acetylglucosamine kinase [Streptomyces griseoaurantiacus]|uniref:BadF-type ATPase n=1 Tax=Streptomyces griseoaurantiacus TaxID=68213 RepID=A0A1G7DDF5_9ACTN|nr:BadF/BadG/BcrA/BcrD ATPase family protein [Streptomyces jietaisiensis]SDE48986.1 BadF-type ATPase [Streptomyces jietaisiensis]
MTVPGGGAVVVGVDSGGSGIRVAVARADGGTVAEPFVSREPVRTGDRGIEARHLLEQLVPAVRRLLAEAGAGAPAALALGAAGMATLGDDLRAELPAALARELGISRLALAADAVTAYTGALGFRPGAVLAAGTGLIALGTDLSGWRRADGWGHLLGDCGSGAWIGRAGLEAALRAHDGRPGGSAALLRRAEEVFGPVAELPGRIYPRADRAAVLASFAPEVAGCAGGDPVAAEVLRAAARHLAESAAAVCPRSGQPRLAVTGGLLKLGEAFTAPLAQELTRCLPHARRTTAEGDPLHGAVRLAGALAAGPLPLPQDPRLLRVTVGSGPLPGTAGNRPSAPPQAPATHSARIFGHPKG